MPRPSRSQAAKAPKQRPLPVVAAEYDAHFARQFGPERWQQLRAALLAPPAHVRLVNRFCEHTELEEDSALTAGEPLPLALSCYRCTPGTSFPPPRGDGSGLLEHYLLDGASLLAVEALRVGPTDVVLDVCAAPGGKAIAALQRLQPHAGGQLQCNDVSPDRCARLRKVLAQYLPREHSAAVRVTQHDATVLTSFPRRFSKVLVDAPCSTDRHLLQNPAELVHWTVRTPEANADRQLKLLCGALQAARAPATVVYSTCALDERENDGVIRAVLRRYSERVRARAPADLPFGEPTPAGGWFVLPDSSDGFGPFYLCVLDVCEVAAGASVGDARVAEGDADGSVEGEETTSEDESVADDHTGGINQS